MGENKAKRVYKFWNTKMQTQSISTGFEIGWWNINEPLLVASSHFKSIKQDKRFEIQSWLNNQTPLIAKIVFATSGFCKRIAPWILNKLSCVTTPFLVIFHSWITEKSMKTKAADKLLYFCACLPNLRRIIREDWKDCQRTFGKNYPNHFSP